MKIYKIYFIHKNHPDQLWIIRYDEKLYPIIHFKVQSGIQMVINVRRFKKFSTIKNSYKNYKYMLFLILVSEL